MQEGRYVLDLLKDLGIVACLDVLNKLFEYLLDIDDLLLVGRDNPLFVHETLFFSLVFAFELRNNVLLLLVDLSLKFVESVLDIVELQLHQSFELFFHLVKQTLILLNESVRIVDHLSQIDHILF